MKNASIYIIGAAVLGWLSVMGYRQYILAKKSCIAVSSIRIEKFKTTYARIAIIIKIKNSTNISFTIFNQKIDVIISNKNIAQLYNRNDIELHSQQEVFSEIIAEFNPWELLKKTIAELLTKGNNIPIQVIGSIGLKSGILFYNNIRINETFNLAELSSNNAAKTPC